MDDETKKFIEMVKTEIFRNGYYVNLHRFKKYNGRTSRKS